MSSQINSNVLFENYENFLTDEQESFSSPSNVNRSLRDNGLFRAFTESLTDGIADSSVRKSVQNVLERQRMSLIEESANVPASGFSHGWSVMSFPILVDIC